MSIGLLEQTCIYEIVHLFHILIKQLMCCRNYKKLLWHNLLQTNALCWFIIFIVGFERCSNFCIVEKYQSRIYFLHVHCDVLPAAVGKYDVIGVVERKS